MTLIKCNLILATAIVIFSYPIKIIVPCEPKILNDTLIRVIENRSDTEVFLYSKDSIIISSYYSIIIEEGAQIWINQDRISEDDSVYFGLELKRNNENCGYNFYLNKNHRFLYDLLRLGKCKISYKGENIKHLRYQFLKGKNCNYEAKIYFKEDLFIERLIIL